MSNPILKGICNNSSIKIVCTPFSIGRALGNSYVLSNTEISRRHCVFIRAADNSWKLRDSSSNGTYINGELVKDCESRVLKNGDIIVLSTNGYSYKFEHKTAPTTTTPTTDHPEERQWKKLKIDKENELIISTKDELTCSICSEMFIKAVTLQCAHTFCKHCIDTWRKNNSVCPMCRTKIKTISPTLTIDNIIAKILEKLPSDKKEKRKQIVAQREASIVPGTSNQAVNVRNNSQNSQNVNGAESANNGDGYNGIPGVYYGGGACYNCGRTGHWARGCPN